MADSVHETLARAFTTNATYFEMMRAHNGIEGEPVLEEEMRAFIKATPVGATLFDAGCGEGSYAVWAAGLLPKASVVAVDLSPVGVKMGAELARERKLKNVSFAVDSLERLATVTDASVDRLYSQSVVEHVPDLPAMFSELMRIMKPGAEGIIRVSNVASLGHFSLRHYLFHRLEPVPTRPTVTLEEGNYQQHRHNFDAHELPAYTLLGLLRQAGLEIVSVTTFPVHLRREPGPLYRRLALSLLVAARRLPGLGLLGPTTIVRFKRP